MPRRKAGMLRYNCHVNVLLTIPEYDALIHAAKRRNQTLTGYARQALRSKLLADETYYYIQTPDGTLYPDPTTPGYISASLARETAGQDARIVRRVFVDV